MNNQEKSLLELFDFNWNLKITNSSDLFHYTNVNALKSILETKEIHASKSNFLNDYSETEYIKEVFAKVYANIKEIYNTDIVNFFQLVFNDLEGYFQRMTRGDEFSSIFIVSLSENIDSLTLWSNYSSIDGYNFGLNTYKLFRLLNDLKESQEGPYDYYYISKIYYDEGEQIKVLYDVLMKIYGLFKLQNDKSLKTTEQAVALCQLAIETYSVFFKKKVFEQEEEFRIAFLVNDQKKLQNHVNYRVSNGSLIPYLKISLDMPDLNPISNITIGPKNNIDISYHGLRHFLKQKGYSDIRDSNLIYKSNITLRF